MLDNFSQKYYGHLPRTKQQHKKTNIWFKKQVKKSKTYGVCFYIPDLDIYFNWDGEEQVGYEHWLGGLICSTIDLKRCLV